MFGGRPSSGAFDVSRDSRFVAAIHFGDEKLSRLATPPVVSKIKRNGTKEGKGEKVQGLKYARDLKEEEAQHDSIVTDSLLQMTSLSGDDKVNEGKSELFRDSLETPDLIEEDNVGPLPNAEGLGIRKNEDMELHPFSLFGRVRNARFTIDFS